MASRRGTRVNTGRGDDIVIVNSPATPVRRRSSSRRAPRKRTRSRSRSSNSSGGYKQKLIGTGVGGFAYGIIEKTVGDKLPVVPVLGKSGTVALACYFFGKSSPLVRDIGVAAAAIAGYSFGKTGSVSGEDDD